MLRSPLMNVMVNAVLKAGKGLKRDFGEVENLQVSAKGPGDFVSIADKKAERVLHQELDKARPGYGFVMEEGGVIEGSDKTHRWHIDPLDGTTNFLHGLPFFSTSVALERDGVLVAGVVYNPATEDLFVAERGAGAFHNDRRIRVSGRRLMAEALVCAAVMQIGRGNHATNLADVGAVMARVAGVRHMGSVALELAYVAAGRFDGLVERWLSSWDIAAGIVLVREAGGFVSDPRGGDTMLASGDVVAGNEAIHKGILTTLAKA
ncbi:inositol monophosphatase family protein [Labrys wisconsinensis]|uniref:Inositol-1-monophosphatase n=1 Tax=Labrys wisconsinensis TaxID=425677 RepID=A0ABU0JBX8_9HYPH|nr:inositol monophosphatase family protein [Labrys wisconsinensis]MDQ0471774.1 myo-inositol-1(or 4)-monophosphatase [Labrys wisconsinensis]